MSEALAIVRVGLCCPVGLDAVETAASLRAGISRKLETGFLSRELEPIVVGHVEEPYLPELEPALRSLRCTSLQRRLLRLASGPLHELFAGYPAQTGPSLHVVGPQPSRGREFVDAQFIAQLLAQTRSPIDAGASRLLALGHAGLVHAVVAARAELLAGQREFAIVGGVDSYLDARRLAELEQDQRLQTSGPQDAFVPGEAAAFLLLARRATCQHYRLRPLAWLVAAGLGHEPGHRYSDEPCLGDGLAAAFVECFADLGEPLEPIQLLLAGLNGERLPAREGGIALLRHRKRFVEALRIEHAAEYTGDAGAALAPLMLGAAAYRMHTGTTRGPALLWACSDQGQRGALILRAHS